MQKSLSLDKNFPVRSSRSREERFSDTIVRVHINRSSRYLTAERSRLDVMKAAVEEQVAAYRRRRKRSQTMAAAAAGASNLSKTVSQSQPSLARRALDAQLTPIVEEDVITTASTPPLRPTLSMLPTDQTNGHCGLTDNNNVKTPPPLSDSPGSSSDSDKLTSAIFDQEDVVLDENGTILAGSLRALIKRLIPRRDYCADKSFIFAFLLNARIFVAPADLLHQILQQCMFEQNAASENFKKEHRTRFFRNILRLCKEWTETFPYDFVPELMLERLNELLSLCSADPSSQQQSHTLLRNLSSRLTKLDRYETALLDIQKEVSHQIWPSENYTGVTLSCDDPRSLAQQLTHIELERLSMIGPEELIAVLSKEYIDNGLNKLAPRTQNVDHYVDWFNRLTYLISTEVTKHLKRRHRVKVIEFFIDVAKECFNIGNFNSLMAIVAGLSINPIARLRKTWDKVEKSKLQILQHQLDPSGNFTSYRSTLQAAIWRSDGAKNVSEKIIVPFFSLFIKDLLILHQKCVRLLPNGHVNFAMFSHFATQVKRFVLWKRVECPFERNSSLLQYLLTTPAFSEKSLQLASFECEAPELSIEKEHHKRLKLELQWTR